jgi:NADPH:quinone reductase-like Zn-dependent oxidoreductase
LTRLGAAEVLERSDFVKLAKPLGKERWAGAIDVVGGQVLANVCATMKYGGVCFRLWFGWRNGVPGNGRALHSARRYAIWY